MVAAGLIETAVTLPTGLAFIVLGLLLWKKQKIELIHEYHHKNVKQQDVPAYTKLWGIALLLAGVCIFPIGPVDLMLRSEIGWVLFAVGMAVCFLLGNKAQKTYNGSWFS